MPRDLHPLRGAQQCHLTTATRSDRAGTICRQIILQTVSRPGTSLPKPIRGSRHRLTLRRPVLVGRNRLSIRGAASGTAYGMTSQVSRHRTERAPNAVDRGTVCHPPTNLHKPSGCDFPVLKKPCRSTGPRKGAVAKLRRFPRKDRSAARLHVDRRAQPPGLALVDLPRPPHALHTAHQPVPARRCQNSPTSRPRPAGHDRLRCGA